MRIAVLTTETLHHAYFVRQLAAEYAVVKVFLETSRVSPPFETSHPFEEQREDYERDAWFDGGHPPIAEFAEVNECHSINDSEAVSELGAIGADVVVVFGTGRLKRQTINVCGPQLLNLHGGDPERYRGLDTHLWAIYHGDFAGLSTTLHRVNSRLDDGQIIANLPIPICHGMELHQLRQANTEVCVRLTSECLAHFERRGEIVSRPQSSQGRYYSFMPQVLKEICVGKFSKYTNAL